MGPSPSEGPVLMPRLPLSGHRPGGDAGRPTGLVVGDVCPPRARKGGGAWSSPAVLVGSWPLGAVSPEGPRPHLATLPSLAQGRGSQSITLSSCGEGSSTLGQHLLLGDSHAESGAVSRPVLRPCWAVPVLCVLGSLQGGVQSCGWVPGSDVADPGLHRGDGSGARVPVQGPLAPDIARLPH